MLPALDAAIGTKTGQDARPWARSLRACPSRESNTPPKTYFFGKPSGNCAAESQMSCQGAFIETQIWLWGFSRGSTSSEPARISTMPGHFSARENRWHPQVLQNERVLPGEELKWTRLSEPATTWKPLSSTARTDENAEPENFRQSGQWQFAKIRIFPALSYFTFPQ